MFEYFFLIVDGQRTTHNARSTSDALIWRLLTVTHWALKLKVKEMGKIVQCTRVDLINSPALVYTVSLNRKAEKEK